MTEPQFQIRLLAASDSELLRAVDPDVFDDAVVDALAEEFLRDPRHHVVVAVSDSRVVGFASGIHYVHPDKEPEMFVLEVGVAETHRRRGVASGVLRRLLAHARELGCASAWVATEESNDPARRLYAELGGSEDAEPAVIYNFSLGPES